MSKKLAATVLGATLAAVSPADAKKHCGKWIEEEYVPYSTCAGDTHKHYPPHPAKPPHPDKPPTNAGSGGGGHHHHHHHHTQSHQETPVPKDRPKPMGPHEPNLYQKMQEELKHPQGDY